MSLTATNSPVCRLVDFGLVRGGSEPTHHLIRDHSCPPLERPDDHEIPDLGTSGEINGTANVIGPFTCWLVMERCSSNLSVWRTLLYELVIKDGVISGSSFLWSCFRIYLRVIEATEALHQQRIIHFDIKCQNALIRTPRGLSTSDEPGVVLSDFG